MNDFSLADASDVFAGGNTHDDVDAPAPAGGYDADRPEADGERLQ